MNHYVLGFLFSSNHGIVSLIKKNRPPDQAGLFNGIGGRIEEHDEHPHAAMVREFQEETGALVTSWEQFAVVNVPSAIIHCFRAFSDEALLEVETQTDETVVLKPVRAIIPETSVPKLKMLITLALEQRIRTAVSMTVHDV